MKRSIFLLLFLLLFLNRADPQEIGSGGTYEQVQNLYVKYNVAIMSGSFKEAYGMLSSFTKRFVSYEIFVDANREVENHFIIKASHLSDLKIKDNYAAAKTITYVDLYMDSNRDKTINGKIESQVYFIKENDAWKIATGDDDSRRQFLNEHKQAKDLLDWEKTRLFYKYEGYWVAFDIRFEDDKESKIIPKKRE